MSTELLDLRESLLALLYHLEVIKRLLSRLMRLGSCRGRAIVLGLSAVVGRLIGRLSHSIGLGFGFGEGVEVFRHVKA